MDGDDPHTIVEMGLLEAFRGWSRVVMTIDGKSVPLLGLGLTQPGKQERYPGLSMQTKKPGERGDMVVTIQVRFLDTLSERPKLILLNGLLLEE